MECRGATSRKDFIETPDPLISMKFAVDFIVMLMKVSGLKKLSCYDPERSMTKKSSRAV